MMKTIKNVTIDVIVLMINCHVSEKPNAGPASDHNMTMITDVTNPDGLPTA